MRIISLSGTLEYRFDGFDLEIPDVLDPEDEKALLEYIDGTLDYSKLRQQSEETLEIYDVVEEKEP